MSSVAPGQIMIVENEDELRSLLVHASREAGYEAVGFSSSQAALAALRKQNFDVLLTDLTLAEMDGITLLQAAQEVDPHIVGIIMTGQNAVQTAVNAMKFGAFDYVLKPFSTHTVLPIFARAMNTRRLRLENLELRETVAIYGLSQTIAFTLEPQTILSQLADAAVQQTGADELSILLPTNDGAELYVAAVRGANRERLLGERVPVQQSISSWVARERTPVILNGEVHDDRFVALWPRSEIHSSVSVPMQVANKLVGVINLNITGKLRPFTLGQMKGLTILAGTAAAALETASLYTKVSNAEENYRSIFENAIEGIFQATSDSKIIAANPAMAHMLGYSSAAALVAAHEVRHDHYVNPQRVADLEELLKANGQVSNFEFEYLRFDGTRVWLSESARAVHDESGALLYYEGIAEDITERRRVEKAQRESQQQYESLVHSIDGIVWELDAQTRRFTFVSKQAQRLLGYPPIQWINGPNFWVDHLHADDRNWVVDFRAEGTARKRDYQCDYRMIAADGRVVWLRDIVTVDARDPQSVRLRGLMVDITEGRRAEQEKAQLTAQLESERQRLDTIVANVPGVVWEARRDPENATQNIDFISDYVETMLGYSVKEWLSTPDFWLAIGHPEDKERMASESAAQFALGESSPMEFRWLAKDGRVVWVQSQTAYISNDNGKPVGVRGVTIDVSKRKQAEALLRLTQQRLEQVVASSPAIIYTLKLEDGHSTPISSTENVKRLLGYEVAETLSAEWWSDGIHPDDRERVLANETVLYERNHNLRDYRFRHKDGSYRWIRDEQRLLRDSLGVPLEIVGVWVDITNRKLAEDELSSSERRFSKAFNASPQPMSICTMPEARYVDVNDSFLAASGFSREEVLARTAVELNLWPDAERHAELIELIHKQGFIRNIETPFLTRGGDPRTFLTSAESIDLEGEKCVLLASSDITDRKRSEEMQIRRAAQAALRANVSAALAQPDVTLKLTLDRCVSALVHQLDAAFARIWTLNIEENTLELQASAGVITDLDGPHARVPVGSLEIGLIAQQRKPHITADIQHDPRAGEKEWAKREGIVSFAGYPLIVEDRLIGVMALFGRQQLAEDTLDSLASIADIISQGIERKRVEEALRLSEERLRQSQKLEAIGQLAGGVAHDFNNLLTVIGGYSSILLGKLPADSPYRSNIEEIKKASDRAGSLTRQLLAFSRKQILQPKVMDLNIVVSDLDKMLRRLIGEDIDLLTLTDPLLGKVKADPGQIEQVLLNLIVNARDAMPGGGKLTIETANAFLSSDYADHSVAGPGNYAMIAVSDTGSGMDVETQARIFDPFFTTKVSGKGTGLGLSTVYGIVTQSGGSIHVYSEVGSGTTFKVYLPRVDEIVARDGVDGSRKPMPAGTETLLLVEDEDQVRQIITQILLNQGYQVISASNGEEALALAEKNGGIIELMISDVVMPQMSGRELAERMTVLRPEMRVLYMSGYTDDAIVRHGLLDQTLNFIQKPFDSASMARKIRQVLDLPI